MVRDFLGNLGGKNQMVQDILEALSYFAPQTRNPHGDELGRELRVIELGVLPPNNYIAQPSYANQNIAMPGWRTFNVPDLFEVTFVGSSGYLCIIDPNAAQDPSGASNIDIPIDGTQFIVLHPGESIKFSERRTVRAQCIPWYAQYIAGLSLEWHDANVRWPSAQSVILSAKPVNHFISQIPASTWYMSTGKVSGDDFQQSFTLINWGRVSKFRVGISGSDDAGTMQRDCAVKFHTFEWASTDRWREGGPAFDPWPRFAKPNAQSNLYHGPYIDTEYEFEVEPFESIHFDDVIYGENLTSNRTIICQAVSNHKNAKPTV